LVPSYPRAHLDFRDVVVPLQEDAEEDMHIIRRSCLALASLVLLAVATLGVTPLAQAASRTATHTDSIVTPSVPGSYAVDGGFISGAVTPLASPDQFRGKDTYFALDPAVVLQSIVHPRWFIVQGVAEPGGGWAYPHQASPNVGTGILRIGVAVNDANHTQLLAAGAATAQARAALPSTQVAASKGGAAAAPRPSNLANAPSCPTGPSTGSPDTASSCYSRTRYVTEDTWWEDPLFIQVTWVSTQLVCDEYYAPSILYCSANDATSWYQPSAWYQVSHSFSWYYYNSHTWAEADTYAHFRNTQFPACFGSAVDNYYSPNWSRDSAWDAYAGGHNTWVTGPACIHLLSLHYWTSIG
jgi:hypothetical protein